MARPNPLAIAIKARIAENRDKRDVLDGKIRDKNEAIISLQATRDALTGMICADEGLLVSCKPGKARAPKSKIANPGVIVPKGEAV